MAKTDLTMKITDAFGKSSTSKVSYVNSNATDSQLATFANKLNAMTTNTLEEASRVSTKELSLTPKIARELGVDPEGKSTVTLAEIERTTDTYSAWNPKLVVYDEEEQTIDNPDAYADMYIKEYTCCLPACIRYSNPETPEQSYPDLYISFNTNWSDKGSKTGTITVALPETDTYAYAEFVITVTE